MKSVEVLFDKKQAKLVVEKGKFDEVLARDALKRAGFEGGARVRG